MYIFVLVNIGFCDEPLFLTLKRKQTMKKIITAILVLCLCLGLCSAAAFSDGDSRTVIGHDLTEAQRSAVYKTFGIDRGAVKELTVTNAEERQYLENYVDEAVIGTFSISCVYIEMLPEGSGMDITADNITWCTVEMFTNAFTTSGITDAKVIVAAPVPVSGTAALTGIYKAYEDITGETLDETVKLIGTQELVVTADLADQIGSYDAASIVNELKLILDETRNMTDEELKAQIRDIAAQYNVKITDDQIRQLVTLCRSLEKLSSDELKQKVEALQQTVQKISEAREKTSRLVEGVRSVFQSIADFLTRLFGSMR